MRPSEMMRFPNLTSMLNADDESVGESFAWVLVDEVESVWLAAEGRKGSLDLFLHFSAHIGHA